MADDTKRQRESRTHAASRSVGRDMARRVAHGYQSIRRRRSIQLSAGQWPAREHRSRPSALHGAHDECNVVDPLCGFGKLRQISSEFSEKQKLRHHGPVIRVDTDNCGALLTEVTGRFAPRLAGPRRVDRGRTARAAPLGESIPALFHPRALTNA